MSLQQTRNVTLKDYDGNVLAGFWQYGSISWSTFSRWLNLLIRTGSRRWAIFDLDKTSADCHGTQRAIDSAIVPPGEYILLQQDGIPFPVSLTEKTARRRHPTDSSNTTTRQEQYQNRVRDRDGRCLITGHRSATWSRLRVAHIFPRTHVAEWVGKGYHHLITDAAPPSSIGGDSKIDSIQNVFMLRRDLRDLWDNYEFGVDPDDDYRITAFINGLDDVHGLVLQLDHIVDPTLRPLDELLRGHFLQGILKHVKGAGESNWDYEDTFGDGAFDLSKQETWGSAEGKERLELEISDRLFAHLVTQDPSAGFPGGA